MWQKEEKGEGLREDERRATEKFPVRSARRILFLALRRNAIKSATNVLRAEMIILDSLIFLYF